MSGAGASWVSPAGNVFARPSTGARWLPRSWLSTTRPLRMLTVDFGRLALAPGITLLDLGCGEGRHVLSAYALNREGFAVGLDLGLADARKTRAAFVQDPAVANEEGERWAVICGDALALPFADESFDRIVCSEVLEHI